MLKKYAHNQVKKIKLFSEKYKTYIMPLVLVLGFLLDFVTLRRVDGVFDNIILASHILIVGISISLLFAKETNLGGRLGILKHAQKIEYLMLFSFGALFSGSIVFYSKSASLSSSWPLFLVLVLLMLATEFQRKYFQRLILQINFYFLAVFAYFVVLVPVILRKMGPEIFLLSGLSSLIFIFIFFGILFGVNNKKMNQYFRKLKNGVLIVFLSFNFLYFSNVIPPIPLSLKFSGVYHSVTRVSANDYVGFYEPTSVWNILQKRSKVVHRDTNEPVYVFSAVFAPTNLNTKIFHQWQYKDPVSLRWVDSTRVEISISGGREGGFRGYSFKRNLKNGDWRVLIETERRQRLGQIKFKVLSKKGEVRLAEEIL